MLSMFLSLAIIATSQTVSIGIDGAFQKHLIAAIKPDVINTIFSVFFLYKQLQHFVLDFDD
jgi:hypothetical protein